MDEFKPEENLRSDPSDRYGRNRKPAGNDEPQINFNDLELDEDDSRPSRFRHVHNQGDAAEQSDETQYRSHKSESKSASARGPVSRQHLMLALGILVLLLLIFAISSALNTPPTQNITDGDRSVERNISLAGNGDTTANQTNGTQPQPGSTSAAHQGSPQDITVPPVASSPTQGQATALPDNQHRVEVQGDLNSALTQSQDRFAGVVNDSTLPTEPATVAPLNGAGSTPPVVRNDRQPQRQTSPKRERQHAVIEASPKTETAQRKPQPSVRRSEPQRPAATASKAPEASARVSKSTSVSSTGNVEALKSAPASHYTLQLSSSSNYNNLNAWAKKENLKNYVVYQTIRNGQPWYVLVSGVYASKDEARRAVSTLPANVQAKNPWTKPIHQVQADLKQ